jgi:hypothetical protein
MVGALIVVGSRARSGNERHYAQPPHAPVAKLPDPWHRFVILCLPLLAASAALVPRDN